MKREAFSRARRLVGPGLLALVTVVSLQTARSFADDDDGGSAPGYIGPAGEVIEEQDCRTCHGLEYRAWQKTSHHDSAEVGKTRLARTLMRDRGLDFRSQRWRKMEDVPLCNACHFTAIPVGGRGDRVEHYGVTCESCHGPAEVWAPIHNSTEGFDSEAARNEATEEAGMIRPGRLYDLAQNCFECHVMVKEGEHVDVEQLVNTDARGDHHPASTPGFELVTWSHGEVRHNFRAPDDSEDPTNPESGHENALYVIGKLMDLEYSLRALALASDAEGRFFTGVRDRITGDDGALAALGAIQAALPEDHVVAAKVGEVLGLVSEDMLTAGNGEALVAAADGIRAAVKPLFNDRVEEWPLEELEESLAPVADLVPAEPKGEPWRPE